MKKLRVYEYARQLNMSSKEILTILKRLDIKVSNHMSVIDEEMIQQVEQFFKNVKEKAAQKQEKQKTHKPTGEKKHGRGKSRPAPRQSGNDQKVTAKSENRDRKQPVSSKS